MRQTVKKNLISNYIKIRPLEAESRDVPCGRGQTDRQTEKYDVANSRFSQIFERI